MQYSIPVKSIFSDASVFDPALTETIQSSNLEGGAMELVRSTGIRPNLKGYMYLVKVVSRCAEDQELLFPLRAGAYKIVSLECGVSVSCLERNIRTAIDQAFFSTPDQLRRYFAYPGDKPYASEFIAVLVDRLRQLYFENL